MGDIVNAMLNLDMYIQSSHPWGDELPLVLNDIMCDIAPQVRAGRTRKKIRRYERVYADSGVAFRTARFNRWLPSSFKCASQRNLHRIPDCTIEGSA